MSHLIAGRVNPLAEVFPQVNERAGAGPGYQAIPYSRRLLVADMEAETNEFLGIMALCVAQLDTVKKRSCWERPWIKRRKDYGFWDNLLVELRREDVPSFKNFMRMPPEMFDEILNRIRPAITKQTTFMRKPLEPGLKLAVTLRHLASGDKYASMKFGFRVPHNTISLLVREVCRVLRDTYKHEFMTCPTTPQGWQPIIQEFHRRWNFPHCCGAIDGKHVAIRKPPHSGSAYYNYKGFFSIVLLALVGPDYKFLYVEVGAQGSASDAQIYNRSNLKEAMKTNDIGFPDAQILPHDNQDPIPYFIVGDDAFALATYLMKPFSRRGLDITERIFNYRLCRCRRIAENAFGILVNRFQVLLTTMCHNVKTVKLIVETCCLLHNIMRDRYPVMQNALMDVEDDDHNIIPGRWRRDRRILADLQRIKGPNTTRAAKKQRIILKHYFSSPVGSVPWQRDQILAGHW